MEEIVEATKNKRKSVDIPDLCLRCSDPFSRMAKGAYYLNINNQLIFIHPLCKWSGDVQITKEEATEIYNDERTAEEVRAAIR